MPKCKKCGEIFSKRFILDGKERYLSSRTNCLNCVPFGKNKKRVDFENEMLECQVCHKEYKLTENNNRYKCYSCKNNYRIKNHKIKCIEYKGGKCSICGYDKCIGGLVFHHLKPEDKRFTIGGSHCRKWEEIEKELNKCILVCGNCHSEIHAGLIKLENLAPEE